MAESESAGGEKVDSVQLRLERIYLKDASFESPQSPAVFEAQWNPEMSVDINTRTQPLAADDAAADGQRVEVVLTVTAQAKSDEQPAFIIEVQQAGVFVVSGANNDVLRRVLGTVCPNTLFPYVRETVDALATRGGFPALQLSPVNFDALYQAALEQQQGEGAVH